MMDRSQGLRILVADGDDRTALVVRTSLENAGFEVVRASSANDALDTIRELKPVLVVLDMMIPGMAGTDLLRILRSAPETCGIPIVAMSERPEEIDRIVGLELGADDYVAKPFSARELTLRIKAILARRPTLPKEPKHVRAGRFTLDAANREIEIDGEAVTLSALDYRLLAALITESGRVVSRERLIGLAWGSDRHVAPRTVDTQLRRLRVKLGPAAKQIRTVRGFGYVLGE